ncbi:MAG TPA: BREX system ATP-binding domain-containing protein [Roseiarcus sp.]|nr:BREX system ATP-binding domain-containing protein [Roseiarcus sp.]
MDDRSQVMARGAIEALRAGVPNRAAIRLLGERGGALVNSFLDSLQQCSQGLDTGRQPNGVLVWGGFGAGKSHLLGYMRELALERNFAVSLVPVSKETPMFDPGRLFAAAVRTAEVQGANDDLMTVVLSRLKPNTEPFERLEDWATREAQAGSLSTIFPALLWLIPHLGPDEHARIARFFGGGRLNATVARSWLREKGAAKLFDIRPTKEKELARQRIRFAPRLMSSSGLAGWCLLLDEVELIGRYSLLQRGRSYAELAGWFGRADTDAFAGIVTVAAFTDDYIDQMFDTRRDEERIAPALEQKGLVSQALLAGRLMSEMRSMPGVRLSAPDEEARRDAQKRIGDLYSVAYKWTPPPLAITRSAQYSMRQHIKSWITEWDIERLFGERPNIEVKSTPTDYTPSEDLEHAPAVVDDDE